MNDNTTIEIKVDGYGKQTHAEALNQLEKQSPFNEFTLDNYNAETKSVDGKAITFYKFFITKV